MIKNLYINRPDEYPVALFGYANRAEFYNLSINLHSKGVSAGSEAAILVGSAQVTRLENIALKGHVDADTTAAGAVGSAARLVLKNVVADIDISVRRNGGGLIGWGSDDFVSELEDCYAIGSVKTDGDSSMSGLANLRSNIRNSYSLVSLEGGSLTKIGGLSSGESEVINSFYSGTLVSDSKENFAGLVYQGNEDLQKNSYWVAKYNEEELGVAGGIEKLKCPIEPGDVNCNGDPIYVDWPTDSTNGSSVYWDFGDRESLPRLAKLPKGLDRNENGTPDSWELECSESCQSSSSSGSDPDAAPLGAGSLNLMSLFLSILLILGSSRSRR